MDQDIVSYIHVIYQKIDSLIETQKKLFDEGDVGCHKENENVVPFLEIQRQINEYYELIEKSRMRAMSQICYNQLMIANYVKDGRRSKEMMDYVFLTINPPDQLPYGKLVSAVKDFTSLCVVDWAYYVFEQRGVQEGMYNGFHTHILFHRDRRPSEVEKAIYRIFSPLVPDDKKIRWWSKSELSEVKNALSYMEGKKDDPAKADKISNDKLMRRDYGLEAMYVVGTPPLLVGGVPTKPKLGLKRVFV